MFYNILRKGESNHFQSNVADAANLQYKKIKLYTCMCYRHAQFIQQSVTDTCYRAAINFTRSSHTYKISCRIKHGIENIN